MEEVEAQEGVWLIDPLQVEGRWTSEEVKVSPGVLVIDEVQAREALGASDEVQNPEVLVGFVDGGGTFKQDLEGARDEEEPGLLEKMGAFGEVKSDEWVGAKEGVEATEVV